LLERIGNTPLLRFDTLTRDLPTVQLLGKAEWYNPGGSVKDRTAASIVTDARRSGKLVPEKFFSIHQRQYRNRLRMLGPR